MKIETKDTIQSKTALITGASSGIGEATAEQLAMARLNHILALQRTAFLRDASPSLAQRRTDLTALKSAMLARRHAIEDAINTDFGHHSRHETAIMEVLGVVERIKYLHRKAESCFSSQF